MSIVKASGLQGNMWWDWISKSIMPTPVWVHVVL